MKYDKNKVVTVWNRHKVQKGDWGWGGDSKDSLEFKVGIDRFLTQLTDVSDLMYPFETEEDNFLYFYPNLYATYQAKWCEENNLEVGDKVKVFQGWERGHLEYEYDQGEVEIGQVYTVKEITCCSIVAYLFDERESWALPYFAIEIVDEYWEKEKKWIKDNNLEIGDVIEVVVEWHPFNKNSRFVVTEIIDGIIYAEGVDSKGKYSKNWMFNSEVIVKVTEEYRPFANAKEFLGYHNYAYRRKNTDAYVSIKEWSDTVVYIKNDSHTWEYFFNNYINGNTGKPAGIPIQPIENVGTTQVRGKVK